MDTSKKEWDAFISHASEDKDTIVRELANSLEKLGLSVWYDEFSLKVGDSLTQKIDEGLLKSNFGIIVISKNFLTKKWTDYEYRSLLSKEDNFKKIILPIWHDIKAEEVKSFSLYLSDKFSLDTSKQSLDNISLKLLEVVRPDIYGNLNRYLLFKKQVETAKTISIDPKDIYFEKSKNIKTLPQKTINRIKIIESTIGHYFNQSLDEAIDLFASEPFPERELLVWEIMTASYLEFIGTKQITSHQEKRNIAKQLLMFSIGTASSKLDIPLSKSIELFDVYKKNLCEF